MLNLLAVIPASAAWVAVGLMLVMIALMARILGRLKRIEKGLGERSEVSGRERLGAVGSPSVESDADQGGAFEEFLNEKSERRKLSKREQFEGFRKWRSEKGLNWSGSEGTREPQAGSGKWGSEGENGEEAGG